jgi:uncharacterized Tic20 family protein
MAVTIQCPSCASKFKAPNGLPTKVTVVPCPKCRKPFRIEPAKPNESARARQPGSAGETRRRPPPADPEGPARRQRRPEPRRPAPRDEPEDFDEADWEDEEFDHVEREAPRQPRLRSDPDERTMAMLCHLLPIVSSFLGPLIIWLIKKGSSRFVDYHGRECLNFLLNLFGYSLILFATSFVLAFATLGVGSLLVLLLYLAMMVYSLVVFILAGVAAHKGKLYRYPFLARLIPQPAGVRFAGSERPDRAESVDDEYEEDDWEDDRERAPARRRRGTRAKKGLSAWVWIGAGGGVALLAVGVVVGLLVFRSRVNLDNLNKVKAGMTIAEVEALLGPGKEVDPGPAAAVFGGQGGMIRYLYWKEVRGGATREVTIPFKDGKALIGFAPADPSAAPPQIEWPVGPAEDPAGKQQPPPGNKRPGRRK